jgi:hypothetical protein
MPATIIASAIATVLFNIGVTLTAATVGYMVFGIRLLMSYTVSRIFAPKNNINALGSDGARVQLPPATSNKLPVSYGQAWLRPVITDAKISTDQKTMWYVLSYCEVPDASAGFGGGTMSFGKIKWGDKTLNFDAVDQTKVISWTNDAGETDTRMNGFIYVYRYRDGSNVPQAGTPSSAITVLQDANIAVANRWAATDVMTKVAFLVIKVVYNQEIGLTGLDQIHAQVTNTLSDPGGCIYNYLLNERYGCGVPLSQIDVTALQNLSAYSAQQITYTPAGGGSATMNRYAINGPIDTAQDCFTNLQTLADASDSWIQWNEANAQWGVVINRAYDQAAGTYPALTVSQLFNINDDNIVGGMQLTPVDLNSTYNRVECSYPDENIYDQVNQVFVDLPAIQLSPNEPDNLLTMQLPVTNNSVTAQYLATRRLIQSREDLVVNLTMDFSGIQIDAGDVVRVNNTKFQWTDKLFRVTQVQEGKAEDGSLYAQLILSEYNTQVYQNIAITEFVPSPNTGITDPNIANQPAAPTISNIIVDSPVGQFTINVVIPASGTYGSIEIYFSKTTDTLSAYTLLKTLLPTNSNTYVNGTTVQYIVTGLPLGNYFFRARVVTMTGVKSPYSAASSGGGGGGSTPLAGPIINVGAGAATTGSLDVFAASSAWTGGRTTVLSLVTTGGPVKIIGSASIQYSIKDISTTVPGSTVTAGAFVVGTTYTIVSVGTTDFTLIGAASNTVGVSFTATGAGSGNGTAQGPSTTTTIYGAAALFQVRLLKDNVYLETYTATYATYVDFAASVSHAVTPNIPFVFYHTPAAGTHNYQIELYAAHFNQNGSSFSSNGTMYGEYYTLAEETTA